MGFFRKIRQILKNRAPYVPLILTQELKDSFNTPSVTGGEIKGLRAIVFGGTGGIGLATVERLLIEGCKVTIAGRSKQKFDEASKYLIEKGYTSFDTMLYDSLNFVENKKNIQRGFFEKYDIFVNTIGVYSNEDGKGVFRRIESQLFMKEINTNFKAAVQLTETAFEDFISKNSGTIINISSINSTQRKFRYTPYGLSKFALSDYTAQKAKQARGTNVSLNVIQPGGVATNMPNVNINLGRNIAGRKSNNLKRASLPEEMAAIIAFLCSPAGKYINGQIITASACEDF